MSGVLFSTYVFSQSNTFITTEDTICSNINLLVDGVMLDEFNSCEFATPQVVDGSTYQLTVTGNGTNTLGGISTIDLVEIQRGILFGFDDPLAAYKSDFDLDGAVSTYDMVELRAVILGVVTYEPTFHVFGNNTNIPNIDPFDIQVDFSAFEFTTADYNTAGEMNVHILKIGDVR